VDQAELRFLVKVSVELIGLEGSAVGVALLLLVIYRTMKACPPASKNSSNNNVRLPLVPL